MRRPQENTVILSSLPRDLASFQVGTVQGRQNKLWDKDVRHACSFPDVEIDRRGAG
jgi:hypothetical protein